MRFSTRVGHSAGWGNEFNIVILKPNKSWVDSDARSELLSNMD